MPSRASGFRSAYLIPAMPPPEVPGRVAAAANSATIAYQSLYRRLMADLAARAEAVEVSLGLPAIKTLSKISGGEGL